jgi:hypothetical protein
MPDESDESYRFPISPIVMKRNARRLVDIMAQFFPDGATSKDLQIRFEQVTGLQRQSFYDTIGFVKYKRWFVGGGKNKIYRLNSDGSWKLTQTSDGRILERDQLAYLADSRAQQIEGLQDEIERLRDWSSGGDADGAGVAVSSLTQIVADSSASMRQRLKAAATVLGYKVRDDGVAEFTKRFLQSVCVDADIPIDYRIEASELLRKHEAPRVVSETIRPSYRDGEGTEAERREAWRNYKIKQRHWDVALNLRNVPHWSEWAFDLYADDFVAPPGWPPWS